jgi:enoyl-CoA hydratase/carnithine racemase
MSDRVTITIEGGVADVRMNRADKMNALDGDQFLAIAEAGERLKVEKGVRAVVLSGEGRAFCAGLDFESFAAMAGGPNERPKVNAGDMQEGRIGHLGQHVAWVWQEVPVPVIAAVHGHALGGGFQIAMGADIRIVHPDTKLSIREVYWGLVPDMTASVRAVPNLREDVAKLLTFTARVISGQQALGYGIATELSDDPHTAAMELAREIAGLSPDAVRGAKELLNRAYKVDAAAQMAEERRIIGSLIGTPNQVEAVMSGLQKRPPAYQD